MERSLRGQRPCLPAGRPAWRWRELSSKMPGISQLGPGEFRRRDRRGRRGSQHAARASRRGSGRLRQRWRHGRLDDGPGRRSHAARKSQPAARRLPARQSAGRKQDHSRNCGDEAGGRDARLRQLSIGLRTVGSFRTRRRVYRRESHRAPHEWQVQNVDQRQGQPINHARLTSIFTMKSQDKPRIKFSVIGLNHGHIYGQTRAVIGGGGELVSFFAKEPDLAAAFSKEFPQAKLAREEKEILEDRSIRLVVSASIPNERARLGVEAMRHGKDFMVDKPGVATLEQFGEVRREQERTARIYSIMYGERFESRAT